MNHILIHMKFRPQGLIDSTTKEKKIYKWKFEHIYSGWEKSLFPNLRSVITQFYLFALKRKKILKNNSNQWIKTQGNKKDYFNSVFLSWKCYMASGQDEITGIRLTFLSCIVPICLSKLHWDITSQNPP